MPLSAGRARFIVLGALFAWGCGASACVDLEGLTGGADNGEVDASRDAIVDSTCGDLASSPDHCGRCDHSCKGSACSAGRCVPTVIASGLSTLQRIFVHDGVVYWSASSEIGRASIDGGDRGVVAVGQGNPLGMASAEGALLWTNWYDSRAIMRAPLDGGPFTTVVKDSHGGADALVVAPDGGSIFWTVNPLGPEHSVRSAFADGGGARTYAVNDAGGSYGGPALAVDAVYWTEAKENGRVLRVRVGETAVTTIASGQSSPGAVAADATDVYWTTANPSGAIVRAAHDGGAPEVVARALPLLGRIAIDDVKVYAIDESGGSVLSVDKATGAIEVLVTDQKRVVDLVVDDAFVYWIALGDGESDGAILRIAK